MFDKEQHRFKTAKTIALSFIVILALTFVGYGTALTLLIHWGRIKEIEYIEHFFNAWLPAITSLTSGAAAFYFARDKE